MTDHQDITIGSKPKRPLSAYNLFFQNERKKLLRALPTRPQGKPRRSHGKCGFANMAKIIAKKWNDGDVDPQDRILFEELARQEQARYKKQMLEYKKRMVAYHKLQKKKMASLTEIQHENRLLELANDERRIDEDETSSSELQAYTCFTSQAHKSLVSSGEESNTDSPPQDLDGMASVDGPSLAGTLHPRPSPAELLSPPAAPLLIETRLAPNVSATTTTTTTPCVDPGQVQHMFDDDKSSPRTVMFSGEQHDLFCPTEHLVRSLGREDMRMFVELFLGDTTTIHVVES